MSTKKWSFFVVYDKTNKMLNGGYKIIRYGKCLNSNLHLQIDESEKDYLKVVKVSDLNLGYETLVYKEGKTYKK